MPRFQSKRAAWVIALVAPMVAAVLISATPARPAGPDSAPGAVPRSNR